MKKTFLTYFDVAFAARGIAMLESLLQWDNGIEATVLCLDDEIGQIITSELGDRVGTVSMAELADHAPELQPLRDQRTPWEFYATHKPVLLDWAILQQSYHAQVAFTDADTFYFSDPSPLFEEAGRSSIVLSPHRFNADTQHLSRFGDYNAGFGLGRNDPTGRCCLRDWSRECLDWCYSRVDASGRFMNQGYLNHWPTRYANVHVLAHPGVNLAPWNVASHVLEETASGVLVDNRPLVFYHFSCLSRNADGA
ncbi:MAG: hypothetical protein ABL994_21565, partial [Verrucomicrobiales bacterium]